MPHGPVKLSLRLLHATIEPQVPELLTLADSSVQLECPLVSIEILASDMVVSDAVVSDVVMFERAPKPCLLPKVALRL